MEEKKLAFVASSIKKYYPEYWDKIDSFPAEKCACIRKVAEEWGDIRQFLQGPFGGQWNRVYQQRTALSVDEV